MQEESVQNLAEGGCRRVKNGFRMLAYYVCAVLFQPFLPCAAFLDQRF